MMARAASRKRASRGRKASSNDVDVADIPTPSSSPAAGKKKSSTVKTRASASSSSSKRTTSAVSNRTGEKKGMASPVARARMLTGLVTLLLVTVFYRYAFFAELSIFCNLSLIAGQLYFNHFGPGWLLPLQDGDGDQIDVIRTTMAAMSSVGADAVGNMEHEIDAVVPWSVGLPEFSSEEPQSVNFPGFGRDDFRAMLLDDVQRRKDDARIPVRFYIPKGGSVGNPYRSLTLFIHGGGWVIGGVNESHTQCRTLAEKTHSIVASIEYRLAPKHKFPIAAFDAVITALGVAKFVGDGGLGAKGDARAASANHIVVYGESAGAQLASIVAREAARQAPESILARNLALQVLVYPVTDAAAMTHSWVSEANAPPLTAELMLWFWQRYLRTVHDGDSLSASPLRAHPDVLKGVAPALILTAEHDVLRDEGEAYGRLLQRAGVDAHVHRFNGTVHAFMAPTFGFPKRDEAIEKVVRAIKDATKPSVQQPVADASAGPNGGDRDEALASIVM